MEDKNKKKYHIQLEKHKWPDEIKAENDQRRRRLLLGVAVLIVLAILLPLIFKNTQFINGFSSNDDKIKEILEDNWFYSDGDLKKDSEDLVKKGQLDSSKDKYTKYYNNEEYKQMEARLEGKTKGLGVRLISIDESKFLISKVYQYSPAHDAGMKAGDIIVEMGGVKGKKLTSDKMSELINDVDTIEIKILRGNEKITLNLKLKKVDFSIYGSIVDNVGVIEIYSFSESTAEDFEKYLSKFKDAGINNIVIDLRENGGGYLNTTLDIAGNLIGPDKVLMQQKNKDGSIEKIKTSKKAVKYNFDNVAVIINENSASASEVLAACLKEHKIATIIGNTSYGKGTMQSSKMFSDGSVLKYTIAEWLTPNANKINGIGVKPDIQVDEHKALSSYALVFDGQIKVNEKNTQVAVMKLYLDIMGYKIENFNDVLEQSDLNELNRFQKENGYAIRSYFDIDGYSELIAFSIREFNLHPELYDKQMIKALEFVRN